MVYRLALICVAITSPALAQEQSAKTEEQSHINVDLSDPESIVKSEQFRTFKAEWKKVYGITVGMTVAELEKHVAKQNAKTDDLPLDQIARIFDSGNHVFGQPESKRLDNDNGTITYWVNGKPQFWLELTINKNKISGIHIAFGNGTWAATPVRLAGKGRYHSKLFNEIHRSIVRLNGPGSANDRGEADLAH